MKISEVIEQLQEIKKKHGDVDFVIYDEATDNYISSYPFYISNLNKVSVE